MSEKTVHVVAGAGPLGTAVARALGDTGAEVRVVSHSGRSPVPPGVGHVAADLADPQAARAACAGAAVVYACAQPPYHRWPEQFPSLQQSLLHAAEASDAVYVSAENLYMYGPSEAPMTESLPFAATTRKGRARAAMAEEVLRWHADGRVRATAGRASDFFGPHVLGSVVGERFFGRLVRGRPVEVYGDPDLPHAYTYVDDFARALVTLGADERAWGRAWHVPTAPAVSTRSFAEQAAAAACTRAGIRRMSRTMLRLGGVFIPEARETVEMLYEFEQPFEVDDTAFRSTFGWEATPLGESIAATVRWYQQEA